METNIFRALVDMLPKEPLLVGTVTAVNGDGTVTLQLPGDGIQRVRGTATVGTDVFFKAGVIDSPAPALTPVSIQV
jgi:hypothetical protein